jgi:hypothetical protein
MFHLLLCTQAVAGVVCRTVYWMLRVHHRAYPVPTVFVELFEKIDFHSVLLTPRIEKWKIWKRTAVSNETSTHLHVVTDATAWLYPWMSLTPSLAYRTARLNKIMFICYLKEGSLTLRVLLHPNTNRNRTRIKLLSLPLKLNKSTNWHCIPVPVQKKMFS